MPRFGGLRIPEELLDEMHARALLRSYFRRDSSGFVYSGAMFDTYYPADTAEGIADSPATANAITARDIVALSTLGIRTTGTRR